MVAYQKLSVYVTLLCLGLDLFKRCLSLLLGHMKIKDCHNDYNSA